MTDNIVRKPFLKWLGNKSRQVSRLKELSEKYGEHTRLVEPFCGSCAFGLNFKAEEIVVADSNKDLINLYRMLIRHGTDFVEDAKQLFTESNNCKKRYLQLREEFNTTTSIYTKSVLFMYLNRYGFNGLCRYNKSGKFNVSFGRYTKPYFPEKEMLFFIKKMGQTKFYCQDFRQTLSTAKPGDLVFCDPPYLPLGESCFTTYDGISFILKDHKDLTKLARNLSQQNITVIIANHDTLETEAMYHDAAIIRHEVRRSVSCSTRRKAPELYAVFSPCSNTKISAA